MPDLYDPALGGDLMANLPTTRRRPRIDARHRRTPEAWLALNEDLDGADQQIRELKELLTARAQECARLEQRLRDQREVRRLADSLMGRLVQDREQAGANAAEMHQQLAQARELIVALRLQLAGVTPATEPERQPQPAVAS